MEKIKSFKDLLIWQKGIEIVKSVYELTRRFPKEETYGLTSQIRRAAVSLPANVAEGFKRYFPKEYRHFLLIALGSAAELETEIIISCELSYLSKEELEAVSEKIDHFSRMISSLLKKL
ncbi:MAG: four helix bundle protein [Candidatus Omnitrophica bacterium]|nr:four helix bundle protein [Candidatus Omnitrophota bacterium]